MTTSYPLHPAAEMPMPLAELMHHLPLAIGLIDPIDGDDVFKAMRTVTLAELDQHLVSRRAELVAEIETIQALDALHKRAIAAAIPPNDLVFAAIEAWEVQP